jgi:hypothetical protein
MQQMNTSKTPEQEKFIKKKKKDAELTRAWLQHTNNPKSNRGSLSCLVRPVWTLEDGQLGRNM